MSNRPPRRRHIRVPAFAPVPVRARRDGWTPARQAAFLGALAETGSVDAAARRVGLSRETAYRLRGKPGAGSFVAAWDKVTGKVTAKVTGGTAARRKVTPDERAVRAKFGLLKVRMYRGQHVATELKPDNQAILSLLAQLDRAARP
ncbi:hypothetical protein [Novosphingobium guangzhouense]|uniref:LysR family transcriptional regulator n=1 Tax=Novosphingobium guangzhouense TaxID=1850347 RepID=A0A2K2G1I0_9SPHN|nr:hypothetical protein [Novosphingobium guangzhouense]PNU04909.1 hypothetical protein A8V01_03440 [Novosphingobium guangzhouense]